MSQIAQKKATTTIKSSGILLFCKNSENSDNYYSSTELKKRPMAWPMLHVYVLEDKTFAISFTLSAL